MGEHLKNLIDKIAKDHNYNNHNVEIKEVPSGGANYTSNLFAIELSSPQKETMHLFAKIANWNEEFRNKSKMDGIFDCEIFYYAEMYKEFQLIEEENNVPKEHRINASKYYGSSTDYMNEILVLENLVARGFGSYERMKPMTWDYAVEGVDQLARFHALGMALKLKKPDIFQKATEVSALSKSSLSAIRDLFFDNTVASVLEILSEENKALIKRYLDAEDRFIEYSNYFKPVKDTTIIHSDYRGSNMLHRVKNGKVEIVVVDYQTMHAGAPPLDLLYFIFTGSDQEFRRLHYSELLDRYYEQLVLALKRLNLDAEHLYSRKEYLADLKEYEMAGLLFSLTVLPVVMVEEEEAPQMELIHGEFTIPPSKPYQERLNGIIQDYIQWGLLK